MADPVEEFQQAVTDIENSLSRAVRAFAEWYSKEWKITQEQWAFDYAEDPPGGPEWFAGYNAGVNAASAAVDSFLGDYLP